LAYEIAAAAVAASFGQPRWGNRVDARKRSPRIFSCTNHNGAVAPTSLKGSPHAESLAVKVEAGDKICEWGRSDIQCGCRLTGESRVEDWWITRLTVSNGA